MHGRRHGTGDAASGRYVGEADRLGVARLHMHLCEIEAELLGRNLGDRGACAGNIDGTHGHHEPRIAGERHMAGRRYRRAAPVAECDAAAARVARRRQRIGPAGMCRDALEQGNEPDGGEGRAGDHRAAGHRGVAQAEFQRVERQALSHLIYCLLHGEGGLRPARAAIGLGPWLVGHDVIALEQQIGALIEIGAGLHLQRRADTGKAAGVVDKAPVDRRQRTVLLGADLHVDRGPGCRTGAQHHLLAADDDLDRLTGFLGEHHGGRLDMRVDLPAETAADLERHHFQQRLRLAEQCRELEAPA